MAWVGLVDTQDGIHVSTSDSSGAGGDFVDTHLGVLSHGQPHTIEWRIKLIPGKANDRVRILIDGQDVGQCFTTWETYYRTSPDQSGPPNNAEPPNINSLQFRTSQGHVPRPRRRLPVRQRHCHDRYRPCFTRVRRDDRQAGRREHGECRTASWATSITARNRGSAVARNVQVCDHIPRHTTFVRADHTLRRVGRRALPRDPAPAARPTRQRPPRRSASMRPRRRAALTNIADVTPGVPGVRPPAAVASDLPGPLAAAGARVAAAKVKRARAVVRVLARRLDRTSPDSERRPPSPSPAPDTRAMRDARP